MTIFLHTETIRKLCVPKFRLFIVNAFSFAENEKLFCLNCVSQKREYFFRSGVPNYKYECAIAIRAVGSSTVPLRNSK